MQTLNRSKQGGFTAAPIILGMAIFGLVALELSQIVSQRNAQMQADSIAASIIEVFKAQTRHFSDINADGSLVNTGYATDIYGDLVPRYLPAWRDNNNNYSIGGATGGGWELKYDASELKLARDIALRFGNIAHVDTTNNTVTISFADPQILAFDARYVNANGDTMTGALDLDGALNLDGTLDLDGALDLDGTLDLHGNNLLRANTVNANTVNANTVNANTVNANTVNANTGN